MLDAKNTHCDGRWKKGVALNKKIPFYHHDLGQDELDAIANVFAGSILTTGDTVAEFEKVFANYLGCKFALGVTSCTGALHMSLLALGIGPGDEVITTPMTFIATSAAILEAGAKPVFVDVEPDTGNLDVALVEAAITSRTKAIMPVHLYGLMCDMVTLRSIADQHALYIIEDCAHCVEGKRNGVRPGQLGDTACFSFYATKNLTCGEGGAVVTNREDLAKRLQLLRLHGMTKMAVDRQREGYKHWDMVMLGWKYNMDNIQAAILLPQMKRINNKLSRRHELAQLYEELLSRIDGVSFPKIPSDCVHARHLFPVRISPDLRDQVIDEMMEMNVSVVVNYRAIHLLTYFSEVLGYLPGDLPNAEHIGNETISLPFFPTMQETQINEIVMALDTAISRAKAMK